MSKSDGIKAATRSGNYQDSVTAPLSRDYDDDHAVDDDDGDQPCSWDDTENEILPPVERVSVLLCAAYSFCEPS
jgi:hypothetical protein